MLCNTLFIISGVVSTVRGTKTLPKEAETTAFVLSFFNELFDSLNGSKRQGLSSILTQNSDHFSFWAEACRKLREMEYVKKDTHTKIKKNNTKCLDNWIWTLNCIQDIWNKLQEVNFESLDIKFVNQDCLENFFSQARNFCGSNMTPSAKQFQEAFKSLLFCNMTSKHSVEANCVEDNLGTSLTLFHFFNLKDMAQKHASEHETDSTEIDGPTVPAPTTNEIAVDAEKIVRIISQNENVKACSICSTNVNNIELINFIQLVTKKLELKFIEICHARKITQVIEKYLEEQQHLLLLSSQCKHLTTALFKIIAKEFVTAWCKYINDILCRRVTIETTNYMYKQAQRMSLKYTKKKN